MWKAELSQEQKFFSKISKSNLAIIISWANCEGMQGEKTNWFTRLTSWGTTDRNNHMIIMVAGELTSIPLTTNPRHVWPKGALFEKHVQCLSEECPVVLKARWPGKVAGRIVYWNICFVIAASEEWKKDTNYFVALFFCFSPLAPRGWGVLCAPLL